MSFCFIIKLKARLADLIVQLVKICLCVGVLARAPRHFLRKISPRHSFLPLVSTEMGDCVRVQFPVPDIYFAM